MNEQGRRKWVALLGFMLLCVGALAISIGFGLSRIVRSQLVAIVEDRFGGKMEVSNLQVSVWPALRVSGENVFVRLPDQANMPLIAVKTFSVQAGLWELFRLTKHVQNITLDGLKIQIPPHENRKRQNGVKHGKMLARFVVDNINAQAAELDMMPKNTGKPARVFMIHGLEMHSVGLGRPASFRVTLTNPKPTGQINATGHFGPWNRDNPSQTPVSGDFTFDHVDMQTIVGLAGTLSSRGKFNGALDRIGVEGDTDTPDFSLLISDNPVHLYTQFKAVVDGTNGDTLLNPVHAEFLHSEITAEGGVYRSEDSPGRRVRLNLSASNAQLQDLLRLAIKGNQPMTGIISFQSKFDLPPGKGEVADRLNLDGHFSVAKAHFTKLNLADKLKALSRAAQGKPGQRTAGSDIFDFTGGFKLKNGTLDFSKLTFNVPGATFHFDGAYVLRTEALNFHGTLSLQAKLSQTTTGIKSVLLKPLDPFFSKNHVTVLPIKVTGTRADPSFGPDFHHRSTKRAG